MNELNGLKRQVEDCIQTAFIKGYYKKGNKCDLYGSWTFEWKSKIRTDHREQNGQSLCTGRKNVGRFERR